MINPLTSPHDLYAALGLSPAATQGQIIRAYRTLTRRHHPDTRADRSNDAGDDEALRRVLVAYAVLRDPRTRAEYDRQHATRHPAGNDAPRYYDPPVVIGDIGAARTSQRLKAHGWTDVIG